MQRQSEISSSSRSKTQHKPKGSSSSTTQQQKQQHKLSTTPNRNSARASSPKQQQQQQQQQQQPSRTPVKIIKSKKPLVHFKFYLDICDHQQTKKIEDKIKQLGGSLEFFLTPSVTHFITDKSVLPPSVNNNNNTLSSRPGTPQTPCTPATPQTPYSHESPAEPAKNNAATPSGSRRAPSIRQSRADAILNRARRGSVASVAPTQPTKESTPTTQVQKVSPKLENNSKQPYIVWQTEQALRFFAKVQHDLKDVLAGGATRERKSHHHHSSKSSRAFGPTHLKGSYIKIESLKRNYRPYYQLFKKPAEWPKIELSREDGAFRLSPKKEVDNSADNKKMTRKSRSRSSQRQQQQPLPAAVQALKKTADSVKSSGQKGPASNANTCKQAAKETSEKQCGVCEICKIEYDTLTIHLKTKDHEYFAKNSQNFIALDTLIHSSADVNKFLEDEQKQEMELEEMEVEEQDANSDTIAAHDPLEDPIEQQLNKRYDSDNTPSPTLREKSKRITKGKHSSEKFQTVPGSTRRSSKSPKSLQTPTATQPAAKSSSPKKQASAALKVVAVGSDDRMGTRNKTASAANAAAATSTVYSPPIRAMLPPSSMYKVVDATPAEANTPLRRTQVGASAAQAVNSPSLIVKFKKVRETELCRLSGEADRFMFRKQRTSSDLPTDLDRQTTSDHLRANHSSTSLDSSANDFTSLAEMAACEKTETKTKSAGSPKKAIAVGKRRKGSAASAPAPPAASSEQRRFPSAPIQPAVQLKHVNLLRNKTAAAALSRRLSLPEATRKSSRTATAIVTAATTSSRLLRAAVEAAKKAAGNEPTHKAAASAEGGAIETPVKITRSSRLSVVKVEDRMGDAIGSNDEDDDDEDANQGLGAQRKALGFSLRTLDDDDDDDDEEDDDEDVTEDDADNDEDFVVNTKLPKVTPAKRESDDLSTRHTTREERAARRWTQRCESLEVEVEEDAEPARSYGKRRKLSQSTPSKRQAKSNETLATTPPTAHIKKVVLSSPPQRHFDIMKSERLSKLRYAFERLPVTDLWYRVYTRQDSCEERYFEYYGLRQYRKLPYEMGPIPLDYTLKGPAAKCCVLCQKAGRVPKLESDKATTGTNEVFVKKETESQHNSKKLIQTEMEPKETDLTTAAMSGTATACYTHKHKKLHLLQRYHQELLQEQQKQTENQAPQTTPALASVASKCDSKASTPEREAIERERERVVRAGSTHSNTSSCTVSSTGTLNSQHKYRNKHLNKANLLNLELPPRKSPREHASTLALVSCIIRQRQDSLSKPNSETDEPLALPQAPASPLQITTTTTMALPSIEDDVKSIKAALKQNKTPIKADEVPEKTPTTPELRSTRSAAATPVEELRFATEISETVKRMRRGQNKYDHSPPIVLKTARPTRGKSKPSLTTSPPLDRRSFKARSARQAPQTPTTHSEIVTNQRRRPRSLLLPSMSATTTTAATTAAGVATIASGSVRRRVFGGRTSRGLKSQPSIRKTGSKKGVLEFEVDTAALRALKAAMAPQPSPRQLEWEIEKYLELAAKDYDCEDVSEMLLKTAEAEVLPSEVVPTTSTTKARKPHAKSSKAAAAPTPTASTSTYGDVNTPPPTDCFSSDFDLYDLIASKDQPSALAGAHEELPKNSKPANFSLYSTVALQNYFRRRKTAKSNRTGWPKNQKKKPSLRHQHLLRQKSRYMPNGGGQIHEHRTTALTGIKAELEDEAASTQDVVSTNGDHRTSSPENAENEGDGVITPPDSEVDDTATVLTNGDEYENEDDVEFLDAIDDTAVNGLDADVDGETIADSIEIERCCTADLEADAAAEADIEAEDEEANDDDDDDDDDDDVDFEDDTTTMYMEQRSSKRLTLRRRSTEVISPIVLKCSNSPHGDVATAGVVGSLTSTPTTVTAAASTPTTTATTGTANMLRGLRRTPVLLNGSLGSCISPSEKAGDNSDIFTVSSDGLDTDLDISNSHTQTYDESHQDNARCPHRTPRRKYDISKYAPNSKNARTCAAEAATAAVKSLAISQFLKKEVRVTCRRLRPPFRRFRFRR